MDYKKLNALMEYVIGRKPVVVKRCKEIAIDGSRKSGERYGRFHIPRKQFNRLKNADGYYLFIVESKGVASKVYLIPANELSYQRTLTWTKLEREHKAKILSIKENIEITPFYCPRGVKL